MKVKFIDGAEINVKKEVENIIRENKKNKHMYCSNINCDQCEISNFKTIDFENCFYYSQYDYEIIEDEKEKIMDFKIKINSQKEAIENWEKLNGAYIENVTTGNKLKIKQLHLKENIWSFECYSLTGIQQNFKLNEDTEWKMADCIEITYLDKKHLIDIESAKKLGLIN